MEFAAAADSRILPGGLEMAQILDGSRAARRDAGG
jgi:hypothetical protein